MIAFHQSIKTCMVQTIEVKNNEKNYTPATIITVHLFRYLQSEAGSMNIGDGNLWVIL